LGQESDKRNEVAYECDVQHRSFLSVECIEGIKNVVNSQSVSFSVVVPAHNAEETIIETLNSVLLQHCRADEIIVVNDGSVDQTARIVTQKFPQVKLVSHSASSGAGPARNAGAIAARNNWIAFVDADDLWGPNHLCILASGVSSHPLAGIIATEYCQGHRELVVAQLSRIETRWDRIRWRTINYALAAALNPGVVWSSAIAVNRKALLDVGGFSSAPTGQDTECWLAISRKYEVIKTYQVTAGYVTSSMGISYHRREEKKREHKITSSQISWERFGPSAIKARHVLAQQTDTQNTHQTRSLKIYLASRVFWIALADYKYHSKSQCVETLAFGLRQLIPTRAGKPILEPKFPAMLFATAIQLAVSAKSRIKEARPAAE
jgi:glycosyltransferase involved in cell wall biosynthesis